MSTHAEDSFMKTNTAEQQCCRVIQGVFFLTFLNEQTVNMESKHTIQHRKVSTEETSVKPIYKNVKAEDLNSNF